MAAQAAALSPRREVSSLVPGSTSRPADIFVPSWVQGQPTALDVTVISPLQQVTLSELCHSWVCSLLCRGAEEHCSF